MLDVQPSISGVLLPVMPLLDTSATPNSNSCHRDSTALRRQRADWRGIEKKGGAMEGLLGAGGQQQFTGKQVIFYAPSHSVARCCGSSLLSAMLKGK